MKTGALILWAILQGGAARQIADGSGERTKADPAIVQVFSPTSRGTGFFIEGGGHKYLVTAAHVCGNFPFLISSKGVHNVLAVRPTQDVCVLSTYQNVKTLKLGEDTNPGEKISMTGFPLDFIYNYQEGVTDDVGYGVYKLPKDYYGPGCPTGSLEDKTDCGIFVTNTRLKILARGGNSGGPVVNEKGEVVGILIGSDSSGNGYMVPVSELVKVLTGTP